MPYHWLPPAPSEPETFRLRLWPHRSLTARGFVIFIAATAMLLALPLISLLGKSVLWVMLPFLGLPLAGGWLALRRNGRDLDMFEELILSHEQLILQRSQAGHLEEWSANPYWLRVNLLPYGGPVAEHLTLEARGESMAIGSFLSREERVVLAGELEAALRRARES